MDRDDIFKKVVDLCKTVFDDDNLVINEETSAKDVDLWDSLAHIVLISEIEDAFDIKFKLDEIQKARNVGELVSIIDSKVNQ